MFHSNTPSYRLPALITQMALFLTFGVILLGAYTRLTDSGLGCPDWPACYGHWIPNQLAYDPVKAWIEMIHRYAAGTLGFFIAVLALILSKNTFSLRHKSLAFTLLLLVVFQAWLGKWTVTLKLYPVVVMGHLLGGLCIFVVLRALQLRLTPKRVFSLSSDLLPSRSLINLKWWTFFGIITLLMQISLGGWTSANYAALACPDFPSCHGEYWPTMNFSEAFNFSSVGIMNSPGTPLGHTARVTIQMAHRIGAGITLLILGIIGIKTLRKKQLDHLQPWACCLLLLLAAQITLGILNVIAQMPLWTALAHNGIAALLLFVLITINHLLHAKHRTL